MPDLTTPNLIYLRHVASFLNSDLKTLILQKKEKDEVVRLAIEAVASATTDIAKLDMDADAAYLWLNKALKQMGHLGAYFNHEFFPLKVMGPITPKNFDQAQDLVIKTLVDEIDFNPQLSSEDMTMLSSAVNNLTSDPNLVHSSPSSKSVTNSAIGKASSSSLGHDTSSYPLKYLGELPPIGTKELDAAGYSKLKELSKTISNKLNIDSILSRFALWARANNISFTDGALKVALGTVLPESHIKVYDPLASDPKVPFHHLAYLLSKKLGGKKTFKVARNFGEELACNMTDPPLKVLEEIESLYYTVEGKDRQALNEEAFFLAETFLTRRFGDAFWAIFAARLEAEHIDNVADLSILFRNHFTKVANNFETDRMSSKKNISRLHHLELEVASRDQLQADVKSILHHLESPQGQGRAQEQIPGANTIPFTVDQGYYNIPSPLQGQYFPTHHISPPAPAPAPAPAPIVMPVLIPGHSNNGPRPNQGKPFGGNRKVPLEMQYCYQNCSYPGHFNHKNKDCQVQSSIQCQYNPRHTGHKANACIRTRDWSFGAIENPGQFRRTDRQAPHGGRPEGSGPRARLQAPPQQPPPRQPQAAEMNRIVQAIKSGFKDLSNSE